jgi:hypothetical protein
MEPAFAGNFPQSFGVYGGLQNAVTAIIVAAVCDRRFFGAHRASLQRMFVTVFCEPQ